LNAQKKPEWFVNESLKKIMNNYEFSVFETTGKFGLFSFGKEESNSSKIHQPTPCFDHNGAQASLHRVILSLHL